MSSILYLILAHWEWHIVKRYPFINVSFNVPPLAPFLNIKEWCLYTQKVNHSLVNPCIKSIKSQGSITTKSKRFTTTTTSCLGISDDCWVYFPIWHDGVFACAWPIYSYVISKGNNYPGGIFVVVRYNFTSIYVCLLDFGFIS